MSESIITPLDTVEVATLRLRIRELEIALRIMERRVDVFGDRANFQYSPMSNLPFVDMKVHHVTSETVAGWQSHIDPSRGRLHMIGRTKQVTGADTFLSYNYYVEAAHLEDSRARAGFLGELHKRVITDIASSIFSEEKASRDGR